jgi:hypothetical protein
MKLSSDWTMDWRVRVERFYFIFSTWVFFNALVKLEKSKTPRYPRQKQSLHPNPKEKWILNRIDFEYSVM